MKTKFRYSFANEFSKKEESPQLDIEAILDTVDYIVCPHKRICRLTDDIQNRTVHLFHNSVPYIAINRSVMAGDITIRQIKKVKCDYEGPGTVVQYNGRMDYESVYLTRNHKSFTRDTNLDCYFSIHRCSKGTTILYIGNQNTKCL
jgi:hypothetical protein